MADPTHYPWVANQFFTDNGVPAASYLLWTFVAGTSEELTTWQDPAFATKNANPIVLDSAGRADVYIDRPAKFILTDPADDSDPVHSNLWTRDNVPPQYYGFSTTLGRNVSGDAPLTWDVIVPGTARGLNFFGFPYKWTTVYSRDPNSSYTEDADTGTVGIQIPAGTFDGNGDCLSMEWSFTYSAAQPAARATLFGTNVDLGIASNSTITWAQYNAYRVDANNIRVMATVLQNTAAGNAAIATADTAIGSLFLDNNEYVAILTNDSTIALDFARISFGSTVSDWAGLTPSI